MIGNSLAKLYWNDASATSKAALHPSLLRARPTKNRTTFSCAAASRSMWCERERPPPPIQWQFRKITWLPRDMSTVVALFISISPAAILRIFRSISRPTRDCRLRASCCGCFFLRLCSLSAWCARFPLPYCLIHTILFPH